MASKGWIKLYRQIQDCYIWDSDEPFDHRSAWIDLLLTANHKDKKLIFNSEIITIKRGQMITSVRKLAEHWNWTPKKTLTYLRNLEELGMIIKESDNQKTLLTIVNYEVFQDEGNTTDHTIDYTGDHTIDPQTRKKERKNERSYKRSSKNKFNDFPQNQYDFDALEEQLVNK